MAEKTISYGLIRRITVDLDTKDFSSILNCLKVLYKYGFTEIEIKESPSGNGLHITGWMEGDGYCLDELLRIREEAGDDKCRIFIDGLGNRLIQVLFTNKKKRIVKVKDIISESSFPSQR